MSTIVLRSVKGSPLTNAEVDANFSNLNTDKTQLGGTYSSGTANGVLFLSASKVLTTGSALTFDGTNLGVGGAAVDSSTFGRAVDARGTTGAAYYAGTSDNTTRALFGVYTGAGYLSTITNHPLLFSINSTEQMRLTSTGLGIGTSSPNSKLQLVSAASGATVLSAANTSATGYGMYLQGGTTGNYTLYAANYAGTALMVLDGGGNLGIGTSSPGASLHVNTASNGADLIRITGGSSQQLDIGVNSTNGGPYLFSSGSFALRFGTSGSEKMRLDSSGNLGLGVTPSAWGGSGVKGFQIASAGAFLGSGGSMDMRYNSYYNGTNDIYTTSQTAFKYVQQFNLGHAWYTAPSGTAGNAITFTQAMTLDASGNLQLGTSSGSSTRRFTVYGSAGSAASTSLALQNSTSGTASTDGFTMELEGVTAYLYNYENGPVVFGTNNAERARIDSNGSLLVGVSSVPAGLSGRFVVGVSRPMAYSDGSGALQIKADAGGWQMGTYFVGSSGTNRGGFGVAGGGDTLSYYWVGQSGSGTGVQLANGGTSWASLSDEREKNIHGVIENALDKVKQLDGIYYNYKSEEEGARLRVGFSAQKVQVVLPEAVTEFQRNPENPTEETKRLSLSTTDLLPLLVQAIKELKAEFDAYKATHP